MGEIIKPGIFGKSYTADTRRGVFDFCNEQIIDEEIIPDCVFIGDSITEYWDLNLYFREFGFVVNRGIGGDISEILVKRFEADALQLKPKKIVCLIGCNDLMTTHPNLWDRLPGNDPEQVMDSLISNIEKIIKMCEGIEIYICSVLPTNLCKPYDKDRFNENVLEVNKRIRLLCENYGIEYIDYHSALCEKDGKTVRDQLTYEGVHPRPQGYKIMADILKAKML